LYTDAKALVSHHRPSSVRMVLPGKSPSSVKMVLPGKKKAPKKDPKESKTGMEEEEVVVLEKIVAARKLEAKASASAAAGATTVSSPPGGTSINQLAKRKSENGNAFTSPVKLSKVMEKLSPKGKSNGQVMLLAMVGTIIPGVGRMIAFYATNHKVDPVKGLPISVYFNYVLDRKMGSDSFGGPGNLAPLGFTPDTHT
jgi:hypothetical protein